MDRRVAIVGMLLLGVLGAAAGRAHGYWLASEAAARDCAALLFPEPAPSFGRRSSPLLPRDTR